MTASDGSTAAGIIKAALGHMQDRASTYDKPKGERSMNSTVLAFAAVTGVLMTEEQGWIFMALLKSVRSQQGAFRADSYEDGAAYFALAGEAAHRERAPVDLPKQDKGDPLACSGCFSGCFRCAPITEKIARQVSAGTEPAAAMEDDSERMRIIGQCGEMAEEVYAAVDAADPFAGAPEWAQWKAQDEDGRWTWFTYEPAIVGSEWVEGDECLAEDSNNTCAGHDHIVNPNWRDTLIQRKQP